MQLHAHPAQPVPVTDPVVTDPCCTPLLRTLAGLRIGSYYLCTSYLPRLAYCGLAASPPPCCRYHEEKDHGDAEDISTRPSTDGAASRVMLRSSLRRPQLTMGVDSSDHDPTAHFGLLHLT